MKKPSPAPCRRVIDVHTHAFPDFLAARAVAHLQEKGSTSAFLDGTVGALRRSMDRAGVEISVVCSIATDPSQFEGILAWSKEVAGERIVPFPSVHPRSPSALEEIRQVSAAGFRGIKLHPEYQDFHIDDPSLSPFYERAAEEGLVILFHAGHDIGFPDSDRSAPHRIGRVGASFPRLRLIASHLGGFRQWDEVGRELVGTEVYLDTSYIFGHIDHDVLGRIIGGHPPDRILFGSDSPWTDQGESIDRIRDLKLSPELEERILGVNARELLDL